MMGTEEGQKFVGWEKNSPVPELSLGIDLGHESMSSHMEGDV